MFGVFREEAGELAVGDRVSLVFSNNCLLPHLLFLSLLAIPQSSTTAGAVRLSIKV